MKKLLPFLIIALTCSMCTESFDFKLAQASTDIYGTVDSARILNHLEYLSSDELEGRNVESEGNQKARTFIISELASYGLKTDTSQFEFGKAKRKGVNIWTEINGFSSPNEVIVISAHYDHVGVKQDSTATAETDLIFNGADDNASGTAALLEIANYFSKNRPEHSIALLFVDAEEKGLQGAHNVVKNYRRIKHVILNLNMDMISRSDSSILNISGLSYSNSLMPLFKVREQTTSITLTYGHDGKDGLQDWTKSSDHYPFFNAGIPFIYFGVEDHPDYHKVSDEFSKVNKSFYVQASSYILNTSVSLDKTIQ